MIPENKAPQPPNVNRQNRPAKVAGRGKQLKLINAAIGPQKAGPVAPARGGQQQPNGPRSGRGTQAARLRQRARGQVIPPPPSGPRVSAPGPRSSQHGVAAAAGPHPNLPRPSNDPKTSNTAGRAARPPRLKGQNQSVIVYDASKRPQKGIVPEVHAPTQKSPVTQTQKLLPASGNIKDSDRQRKLEIRSPLSAMSLALTETRHDFEDQTSSGVGSFTSTFSNEPSRTDMGTFAAADGAQMDNDGENKGSFLKDLAQFCKENPTCYRLTPNYPPLCPRCKDGHFKAEWTPLSVFCCVCVPILGIPCCYAFREYTCTNCGEIWEYDDPREEITAVSQFT